MSKKIVYLITEMEIGGAQRVLNRLLAKLDRNKFEPMVVCFYNGDSIIGNMIRKLDIPVIDIGFSKPWNFYKLWRLWHIFRHECPTILHCWLFHANLIGRIFGHFSDVPIIITSRRNVEIGGRYREFLKRMTNNYDHAVVAVSERVRKVEIERNNTNPEKVITIHNGVDISEHKRNISLNKIHIRSKYQIPNDIVVIATVSRLLPQKGLEYLVFALRDFYNLRNKATLFVAGDGVSRQDLEQLVVTGCLQNSIYFLGWRSDIPHVLSCIDIFVLPSLHEGMPNVILEAMAAGLPVVATNVGGTPEVVVDGETGFLVPPRDPKALADAIVRLINDPELRKRFGQAGRERIEKHFTIQETVRKTEALYSRLLKEKGIEG
jgi:glycosyltransferase involved in cell wall biosynthesis